MNPKSLFRQKIKKSGEVKRNQGGLGETLTFPACGMLSHFTNSRPTFPLSELTQTKRFRGSMRGQSGHLVSGTTPYRGHDGWEAELELDISRCRASSPDVGEVTTGVPLLTCCCARTSKSFYNASARLLTRQASKASARPLAKDSHQGLGELPSPR